MNTTITGSTIAAAIAAISLTTVSASAVVLPFEEGFDTDTANWFNAAASAPVDWSAAGGPDGSGYATSDFNFQFTATDDTPVLFRGQDEFNSSGNAFAGDWIADGVTEFSFTVRHNAPAPLTFFTRFAGPGNIPGATAIGFAPVLPNTWTTINIGISAFNPQFISFEGQTFEAAFSNIGHLQVGVSVPAGFGGVDQAFSFDLDQVRVVPSGSAAGLFGIAGIAAVRRRKR